MGGRLLGKVGSPLQKSSDFPYHFSVEIATETEIVVFLNPGLWNRRRKTEGRQEKRLEKARKRNSWTILCIFSFGANLSIYQNY